MEETPAVGSNPEPVLIILIKGADGASGLMILGGRAMGAKPLIIRAQDAEPSKQGADKKVARCLLEDA